MAAKNPQDDRYKYEVGNRLRKARLSLGLTQKQVAERMEDPRIARMLTLYENGGDHMRMLPFFRLTKAVGLTPNDVAPSDMFARGESIIDNFLDLTLEHQDLVRSLIKTLWDSDHKEQKN